MVITETARILSREFVVDDTPALSRILGDPSVMEFSSKGPMTEKETEKFIQWCRSSYQEYGHGQWALVENPTTELIGFCGLSHAKINSVDEVELAYRLAKDQWGKGLATEAASQVLSHGFSTCNLDTIISIVSPCHKASIRVLEKIGFKSYSETRYSGWDVRVYRMEHQDWKSNRKLLQYMENTT